jgi:cell shape-determining protein MreC
MIQTDSNVLEIARAQKLRLKVAEEQIEKLRDENKQLQSALGSSSRKDVMKQV